MGRSIKVGGVEYHMSDASYELACEGAAIAMAEQDHRDDALAFEVIVGTDRAEAETLGAALLAAATLLDDQRHHGGASHREARQTIYILRDGKYDGLATTKARTGQAS